MRRTAVLLAVASALLLLQAPAPAGGWWTSLDVHEEYLGIGEPLTIKINEVLYESIEAAERAELTDYFAYLVKDFDQRSLDRAMTRPDPRDWWQPLSTPIQAGRVTLFGRDANLARGLVHLTVPDVPPGRYSLMLCDAECRTPLGNHIPVPVNVTSDAFAAQTTRRFRDLNERLTLALARVRQDVRQTRRQLRQVEADAAEALDAVAQPEPALATERETNGPSWIPYAGWFLAGAAVAFTLRRRRKVLLPEVLIERVPDDARELTKTP